MIFASLVFSAVAVFLGIFTKLPQGGGGLVNNLMVMSCFLSSPPLLPSPPPPRAIFFDIDEAIFGTHEYFLLHPKLLATLLTGQCLARPQSLVLLQPAAAPFRLQMHPSRSLLSCFLCTSSSSALRSEKPLATSPWCC